MNTKFKIGDKVKDAVIPHEGIIVAGPYTSTHGGNGWAVQYKVDVLAYGDEAVFDTVCLQEKFLTLVKKIDSFLPGDVFETNHNWCIKIFKTYDDLYLLGGLCGNLNCLYADSPRTYEETLIFLNNTESNWKKVDSQ